MNNRLVVHSIGRLRIQHGYVFGVHNGRREHNHREFRWKINGYVTNMYLSSLDEWQDFQKLVKNDASFYSFDGTPSWGVILSKVRGQRCVRRRHTLCVRIR